MGKVELCRFQLCDNAEGIAQLKSWASQGAGSGMCPCRWSRNDLNTIMDRALAPNVTVEEKLAKAWFQNDCGDEKCKEHRLAAALLVIGGGREHVDYAEMVRIIDYSENRHLLRLDVP